MDTADFRLHLVLRSRMSGATPPFRHMPSWRAERQVDFVTHTHTHTHIYIYIYIYIGRRGHAVAQLVEALRYKPEGRGFDSRWCHWIFSLT